MHSKFSLKNLTLLHLFMFLSTGFQDGHASDWPSWRGPDQNGVSTESGLISEWSVEGKNLIWKANFTGRSTPIVLGGRVYVMGRVGREITKQERVACFDARTGNMVWEHRFNVFHTTIPFNRVGWASPVGDPETGNIYAHGVGGPLICFNRNGDILWSRSLTEEFGRISGYGGRVHTPVVDMGLVIISFLNSSWGDQIVPRHRYYAFDKLSGEVVWVSAPGGRPLDTTYSTPVVKEIQGQRLLIGGNADGWIYAVKVRTGEKVWGFQLSKRGINSSVVVSGTRVYASHSEENIDNTAMGRVVCIDGMGTGDITKTNEVWRSDECLAGYTSPVAHGGRVYFVDNSANIHCLDAGTGELDWKLNLGTVGKGSPVWADGKLYVPEVNGTIHIVQPVEKGAQRLDVERIRASGGHLAEIFGSPAIGYCRIYFATAEGLYCLGDKDAEFSASSKARLKPDRATPESPGDFADRVAAPAHIRIVPSEVSVALGKSVVFRCRALDSNGQFLKEVTPTWSLDGLSGMISRDGLFIPDRSGPQAGTLVARLGGIEGRARVRVVPDIPWSEDFEGIPVGQNPAHWIGASKKFVVAQKGGNRVLVKSPVKRGLNRSNVYLGPSTLKEYTIQADLMGSRHRRNQSDMGLIANRYTLDMMGNHQRLQVRSWASDLRMAKTVGFRWEPDTWYTMKMRVDILDGKGIISGKVWRKGGPEPEVWTISAEDPLPNLEGSPGLYGYSAAEIWYDNVKVMRSGEIKDRRLKNEE